MPENVVLSFAPPAAADATTLAGAAAVQPYAHSPLPSPEKWPAGFEPLVATPELLLELEEASAALETATPEEIIAWAAKRFGSYLTMATAFGPEGSVILSMLATVAPETYVFNLDTGYQFIETLDLRDRILRKYGMAVDMLQPELTVPEYEAMHGGPLYKTDPNQCCFDRKVKVLREAVRGKHAWMSGIRRDQTGDRARAAIVEWDKKFNLVKISPLANWTKKDVWKRILAEDIPYNPLHDRGYPSIGCWPCTRPVAEGDDPRSGRWAGTDKTECGIHLQPQPDGSVSVVRNSAEPKEK
jgi:phosphoadenosine phosphosulfate reductase